MTTQSPDQSLSQSPDSNYEASFSRLCKICEQHGFDPVAHEIGAWLSASLAQSPAPSMITKPERMSESRFDELKSLAALGDTSDECLLAKAELEGIRQDRIEAAARAMIEEMKALGFGASSSKPLPGSFDELVEALNQRLP